MQKLHITNIVYGEEYTNTFLYTMISLVKNFEYIKQLSWPSIYRIYTTDADKKVILKSVIFKKIQELVEVKFIKIDKYLKKTPHETLTACHNDIIKQANKEDGVIIFLLPDLILSNNLFKKICDSLSKGIRALVGSALRLNKENFIKNYNKTEIYNLSPKMLVKKALSYLHFMTNIYFWDSGNKIWEWTALLCWKLDTNNILIRGFHLHPIFVWPERKKITCKGTFDTDFIHYSCPDKNKWEILQNSNDGVIFELSASARSVGGFSYQKIKSAYKFIHINLFRSHMHFAQYKIYILSDDYKKNNHWQRIEKKSDKIINLLSHKYNNNLYRNFIWPLKEIKYKFFRPIYMVLNSNLRKSVLYLLTSSKKILCLIIILIKKIKNKLKQLFFNLFSKFKYLIKTLIKFKKNHSK